MPEEDIIRAAVVEDDQMSREYLEHMISAHSELNHVASFKDGLEALNGLQKKPCDLIFLDIEMPRLSGMDFMKMFDATSQIIIVSANPEYAAESYDFDVTDYLVKPVLKDRFHRAVDRALSIHKNVLSQEEGGDSFFVKTKSGFTNIPTDEIVYVEAMADYVRIHTKKEKHMLLSTMKAMELKLLDKGFLRIHRSYIVALKKISRYENYHVFINDQEFPVSRTNRPSLTEYLKNQL